MDPAPWSPAPNAKPGGRRADSAKRSQGVLIGALGPSPVHPMLRLRFLLTALADQDDLPWYHADSGLDEPPEVSKSGAWAPASARLGRRAPRWRSAAGYGAAAFAVIVVAVVAHNMLAPAGIPGGPSAPLAEHSEQDAALLEALHGIGLRDAAIDHEGDMVVVTFRNPEGDTATADEWTARVRATLSPHLQPGQGLVIVQTIDGEVVDDDVLGSAKPPGHDVSETGNVVAG